MKQTIVPTKWEEVFHLYLWGTMVTLAVVAFLDFLSLLCLALTLDLTTLGEEQIVEFMPLLVLLGWGLSAIIGWWLHKRHLTLSCYDFSENKIRLAGIISQVYSAIVYFVIIAVI